jgi:hypothetical protein
MEGETGKFAVISEIYAHFSENNKENLIRIAENLLKTQKEGEVITVNASRPMATEME